MVEAAWMSDFTEAERRAVYKAIALRRDIRRQFQPTPIPPEVLARLLAAAHRAGSVGFMQPWDFVVIRDREIRRQVLEGFLLERDRAALLYEGARRDLFLSLKLEGIMESAVNICITCDRSRGGPHVLGRNTILDTDLYSTCCAIQNLWLAARAEGIGVGWVSILSPQALSTLLGLPDSVVPVAYLCVGYVDVFPPEPELERVGWRRRLPLAELVHLDRWGSRADPELAGAVRAVG
jgi:5,6-dimethylbenzimidazole synthase